jgi:quinol-cytochrome oxidoreductase complex cytochrome b subunit
MLFFVNFFILGYVGMKPAEGIYLLIARFGLAYYFGFFLVITPIIGKIEKPKQLPASISDIFSDKNISELSTQKETH